MLTILVLTPLLLTTGLLSNPAVAQPPNHQGNCIGITELDGVQNPGRNATVPIVLVHGILSSAERWNNPAADGGRNLARVLAQTAEFDTSVWAFDYQSANREWVDDSRIGPTLAAAIDCLNEVSGSEVILVAHSNGGNAIRYALGDEVISDMVAHVTTIAAPFEGAELAGATIPLLQERCLGGVTTACWLLAIANRSYPVTEALRPGSTELRQLPAWPSDVQAFKVAASIELNLSSGTVRVGDLTMSSTSALSPRVPQAGQPVLLECGPMGLLPAIRSPCFHNNIPEDRDVISEIRDEVTPVIDQLVAELPDPGDPGDPGDGSGLANRTYFLDCPGGSRDYPLTDGHYEEPYLSVDLVHENLIDLNNDGEDDAIVLLSCMYGAGGIHDTVHVLESAGEGEWEEKDAMHLPYITPIGDATYAGHEPIYNPGDPRCCPTAYTQWQWEIDLTSNDVFVEIEPVRVIDPEDLPPAPPNSPRS